MDLKTANLKMKTLVDIICKYRDQQKFSVLEWYSKDYNLDMFVLGHSADANIFDIQKNQLQWRYGDPGTGYGATDISYFKEIAAVLLSKTNINFLDIEKDFLKNI